MLFHYTSVDINGVKVEADIESLSLDTAVSLLQKKGLSIVEIKEKEEPSWVDGLSHFRLFKRKIKRCDQPDSRAPRKDPHSFLYLGTHTGAALFLE